MDLSVINISGNRSTRDIGTSYSLARKRLKPAVRQGRRQSPSCPSAGDPDHYSSSYLSDSTIVWDLLPRALLTPGPRITVAYALQ